MFAFAFLCCVCALGSNACFMSSGIPCVMARGGSYIDLVVAKALLHLVEQAAVSQLTEGCQVVIGSWRHQFDLRRMTVRAKSLMTAQQSEA